MVSLVTTMGDTPTTAHVWRGRVYTTNVFLTVLMMTLSLTVAAAIVGSRLVSSSLNLKHSDQPQT